MRVLWIAVACVALLACGEDSGTSSGDAGTVADTTAGTCPGTDGNGTEVGQVLSDMSLTNCTGETVVLSDALCTDKKLALIYMASGWCQPCREKQPTLQKWAEQYGPDGLEVMVILPEDNSTDPATKAFCEQWQADYGLSFPVVIDPTKKVSGPFLTGGAQYPVVMLVDKDFKIQYKQTGANDPDLETLIQAYLSL